MPKLPDIDDFINYNKNVGPLQLLEVGYPGTGKSSHATSVIIKCFERKNETVLMHGDITCEWKHFLNYPRYIKKIKVLFHKDIIIVKRNIKLLFDDKYKVALEFIIDLDFNNLNIIDYLEDKTIVVVYDDCFDAVSKTLLWVNIARQLITRDKLLNFTITYLCHEAGNIFPQTVKGKQWEALDEFVSYFVYFRRMGIRAMLLTQIETEVYDRIRKKCIWKVYRICYPADRGHSRLIKKYIKKMSIKNYHIFFGDLFSPLNSNKPTLEIRTRTMIIPRVLINLKGGTSGTNGQTQKNLLRKEIAMRMKENGDSMRKIAKTLDCSLSTAHRWTKHIEKGVKPKENSSDEPITI